MNSGESFKDAIYVDILYIMLISHLIEQHTIIRVLTYTS